MPLMGLPQLCLWAREAPQAGETQSGFLGRSGGLLSKDILFGAAVTTAPHACSVGVDPVGVDPVGLDPGDTRNVCRGPLTSTHARGIQVLMMDGSVCLISDSVDRAEEAEIDTIPNMKSASDRQAVYGI